jgi:hypothetical protein
VIRFWEKVNKNGPTNTRLGKCWVWTACITNGYGRFSYKGYNCLAHVVSWILSGKPEPLYPEEQLDHLCRNSKCIRPSHLELVDNRTNSQRSRKSTLNPRVVLRIRRLYASGRFTYRSLALHLGVGKGAVDYVLRGKTWENIKK